MRLFRLLAVLAAAAVLAGLLVIRARDDGGVTAVGTVTLFGDSLNVGIEPYVGNALPGWKVLANDRVGRATPEGIAELVAGRVPQSPFVVVSLGTNDPPGAVEAFRADVARVLRLVGPERCVVWATIWRDGAPDDAFNAVLRDAAARRARLELVDWAAMVHGHPEWLAPDCLHGNETGYAERARAVAAAVRSCVPGQTLQER